VNFDAVYSFGSYDGTLQKLIHLFKYGRIESLAKPLSAFLLRALPRDEQFDTVVSMPMHWVKRTRRGYNQAELLAKPVATRLGLSVSHCLKKTRNTRAQAGLTESERQANLKDSFKVTRRGEVAGKRILLIDDVFTTGATLRAAVGALKKAGALRVTALTLARVDRPASKVESF
jgi:ComF family protein